MNYPEVLLPNPNFKIIKWHENLNNCSLVRAVDNKDFYDYENKELKVDLIKLQKDHLRDYSTNLLGLFKAEHCSISLIGDKKQFYIDPWEESEKVSAPQHEVDFINTEKYCFYLDISDLHNKTIKYTFKDNAGLEGKCEIMHTPTKSNFWHFSVRCKNSLGQDLVDKEINIHAKAVLSNVKNHIKVCGKPVQEKFGILSTGEYINR